MTYIITGCALVDDTESRIVWGDLHEIGGAWVFNAVLSPKGEADWQTGDDFCAPETTKQLIVTSTRDYFERRGVIIVNRSYANLNRAARLYLGLS